jgi:hypothetical protein
MLMFRKILDQLGILVCELGGVLTKRYASGIHHSQIVTKCFQKLNFAVLEHDYTSDSS